MENLTTAHSHKTQLTDRTLWFDGDSSFDPQRLLKVLQDYDVRYVDYIDEAVKTFNQHASKEQELAVKQHMRPLSFEWNIPEKYKSLDVKAYVLRKQIDTWTEKMSEDEFRQRVLRVIKELKMYDSRGLFDVLRAIIFVINTLTTSNAVWGVGRGSSVSSYVLYLIGVHDVDSFAYNLDIDDFLHD